MPDLPQREDLEPDRPPSAADPASSPGATAPEIAPLEGAPPTSGFPRVSGLLMIGILTGVLLYGAYGFLREVGLVDGREGWVSLRGAPNPTVATDPAPVAAPSGADAAHPLRDQPPHWPRSDLPQFTVRDGEPYDFLTDLDAETLQGLATIQGQLDGFSAQLAHLEQGVLTLTQQVGQQRQQEAIHQSRLQQALAAARQEIAALHTTVGELEARLQRAGPGSGRMTLRSSPVVDSRTSVVNWSIKAVSGNRAWLRTPQGREVTVTAGDRLKGLGIVQVVDAVQGVVVLRDGRVMR
jgi:hypothetical protein